ncbi:MAG: DUF1343 domain-containing protein [Bacteroidales bacterium]|nr:DUF1343 domain-containing protein [Bacteroidales bacterium]MDD2204665.1 DUF1343 domain-containing protein [Bacteroidales bacterium]MDD3151312.1 DUF1343 domain-containing protein [Bacteroidales bacterium]MDD3913660.1 DUF1343 domain-containing protein [Bacteroidales bacterium]MDD4633911.1 DUF1343 domain-containing protein [Bacteroidales bacterium]
MKVLLKYCLLILLLVLPVLLAAQPNVVVGAERTDLYFHLCQNKKIGLVVNHTSLINHTHLVDSLLLSGFNIQTIFSPEHGFRGETAAGDAVKNSIDPKTNLKICSLYGVNKKPSKTQLSNVDIVIFDLQDVGTRFYTYISTLAYVMEACQELNIPLVVLDRPNPNASFIDGPTLHKDYASFVGMYRIPAVYGMTIGEYALMVNGEHWLPNSSKQLNLTVIPLLNYTHKTKYKLPVNPSPNLPNMNAVKLYPSLCFFEGTCMSVGRGTNTPFEVIGYPDIDDGEISFTPKSVTAAPNPKLMNQLCYGYAFDYEKDTEFQDKINVDIIIKCYNKLKDKSTFFIPFFDKLAGTDQLRTQIEAGLTEEQIRSSWQNDINDFLLIRKKYLLYD